MKKQKPLPELIHAGTAHEAIKYRHDCFGQISVTKVACSGGHSMFGSALNHANYISITLNRASLERRRGRDQVLAEEPIVRFAVSEAQWAQLVSSIGCGTGTPVTLERAPSRGTPILSVPDLDSDPIQNTFESEMNTLCEKYLADGKQLQAELMSLSEGTTTPTKKKLRELAQQMAALMEGMPNAMASLQNQFSETMEQTTEAAKVEVESFVANLAMQTGLQILNEHSPLLELPPAIKDG